MTCKSNDAHWSRWLCIPAVGVALVFMALLIDAECRFICWFDPGAGVCNW